MNHLIRIIIAVPIVLSLFVSGTKAETRYGQSGDSGTPVFTEPIAKGVQSSREAAEDSNRHAGVGAIAKSEPREKFAKTSASSSADKNFIHNDKALAHFLRQLLSPGRAAMNGVTVYHFGDSHVRSGVFPGSLAKGLQKQFGDGGGLFCYNKRKVSGHKKRPSKVPAAKIVRPRRVMPPSPEYLSARNQLWEKFEQGGGGSFGSRGGNTLVPLRSRQPRIARPATNDSADKSGGVSLPDETCAPIGGDSEVRPSSFSLGRVQQSPGLSYYAYGIPGKTIDYFSRSRSMQHHLTKYRPDLVIITLGTNDAFAKPSHREVTRHLARLFKAVRRVSPDSSILFTVPPDSFFRSGANNKYTPVVRKAVVDFCRKNGCAWWDLYEIMGGAGSMNTWRERGLGHKDRIHFTSNGYQLMGELVAEAIIRSYTRAASGRTQ